MLMEWDETENNGKRPWAMPAECREQAAKALGISTDDPRLEGVEDWCKHYLAARNEELAPGEVKRLLKTHANLSRAEFSVQFKQLSPAEAIAVEHACVLYGNAGERFTVDANGRVQAVMDRDEFLRRNCHVAAQRMPRNTPRDPYRTLLNGLLLTYEQITETRGSRSVQKKEEIKKEILYPGCKPVKTGTTVLYRTGGKLKKFLDPCLRAVGIDKDPDSIIKRFLRARIITKKRTLKSP
jgi:hypothetical protein